MSNPWDARYDIDGYLYGAAANAFLVEQAPLFPAAASILCLAEGEGRNGVFLAELGHRVVAVDQSSVGLRKAARLAAERGVKIETICADLAEYRIEPNTWDAVVSIWCHLPSALRATVHAQVVAGLKPGGLLVLEAYTPDQLKHGTGGPPTADLMMTLAALREELKGLELLHAVEIERTIHEGRAHLGLSAVVQVVARKPVA